MIGADVGGHGRVSAPTGVYSLPGLLRRRLGIRGGAELSVITASQVPFLSLQRLGPLGVSEELGPTLCQGG